MACRLTRPGLAPTQQEPLWTAAIPCLDSFPHRELVWEGLHWRLAPPAVAQPLVLYPAPNPSLLEPSSCLLPTPFPKITATICPSWVFEERPLLLFPQLKWFLNAPCMYQETHGSPSGFCLVPGLEVFYEPLTCPQT